MQQIVAYALYLHNVMVKLIWIKSTEKKMLISRLWSKPRFFHFFDSLNRTKQPVADEIIVLRSEISLYGLGKRFFTSRAPKGNRLL